jgi:hypothetical protein
MGQTPSFDVAVTAAGCYGNSNDPATIIQNRASSYMPNAEAPDCLAVLRALESVNSANDKSYYDHLTNYCLNLTSAGVTAGNKFGDVVTGISTGDGKSQHSTGADGKRQALFPSTTQAGNMINYPIFYSTLCQTEIVKGLRADAIAAQGNEAADVSQHVSNNIKNFCSQYSKKTTPFWRMTQPKNYGNMGNNVNSQGSLNKNPVSGNSVYTYNLIGYATSDDISPSIQTNLLEAAIKAVKNSPNVVGITVFNITSANSDRPKGNSQIPTGSAGGGPIIPVNGSLIFSDDATPTQGSSVSTFKDLFYKLSKETTHQSFISIRSSFPTNGLDIDNSSFSAIDSFPKDATIYPTTLSNFTSELYADIGKVEEVKGEGYFTVAMTNVRANSVAVFTAEADSYPGILGPVGLAGSNRRYWSDLAVSDQTFSIQIISPSGLHPSWSLPDASTFAGARLITLGSLDNEILDLCACHLPDSAPVDIYSNYYNSVVAKNPAAAVDGTGRSTRYCLFPGCGASAYLQPSIVKASGGNICKTPLCSQSVQVNNNGSTIEGDTKINQSCTNNTTNENEVENIRNKIDQFFINHHMKGKEIVIIVVFLLVGAILASVAVFILYHVKTAKKKKALRVASAKGKT